MSRGGALPLEQFARVVTINLIGTFNVLRIAAAAMAQEAPVDGERGVIISASSIGTRTRLPSRSTGVGQRPVRTNS